MASYKNQSIIKLCIFILACSSSSFGLVSLQNGNYYYETKPVELPATLKGKLDLLLSYNSRSVHPGIFGFGWGTEFETRLVALPEGAIVIYEIGGADGNRYASKNLSAKSILDTVNKIMTAMGRKDKEYKEKLLSNAELRAHFAEKHGIKGVIKPGTKLYSFRRKLEVVEAKSNGYVRYLINEGKEEHFDKWGRLYIIKTKSGTTTSIGYSKSGKIEYLEDPNKRKIYLSFTGERVNAAWSSVNPAQKAFFEYDSHQNLSKITFANSAKETYTYDPLHNMRSISFPDGTTENIYYDRTGNWVAEVHSRDKKKISYQQWFDPASPKLHMKQTLTITSPNSPARSETYEYFKKIKAGGELWLSQMKTTSNGEVITKHYDQKTGMPTKEVSNKTGTTTYQYNGVGLLTNQKNSDGSFKSYEYRPGDYKVTMIKEGTPSLRSPSSKSKLDVSWVKMEYDGVGRINKVFNHKGDKIGLNYDPQGRITHISDNKNSKILFSWNKEDRPVVIDQPGVGRVHVTYNTDGSIKHAESPQGQSVASQVSLNLQKMLTVVQPAGVSL